MSFLSISYTHPSNNFCLQIIVNTTPKKFIFGENGMRVFVNGTHSLFPNQVSNWDSPNTDLAVGE